MLLVAVAVGIGRVFHCGCLSAPPSPPASSGLQAGWWYYVREAAMGSQQLDDAVITGKNLKNENKSVSLVE